MSTLNTASVTPTVRQARLRVLLAGEVIPGAISADVTTNNWYQPDRFSLAFALNADPARGLAWWSDQQNVQLDTQVSLNGGASWASLVVGNIDAVSLNPIHGLLEVEGRDLSSVLHEARTQEAFQNRTASEIATILAGRHGLTADVDATTTLVSRWFAEDHDHITLGEFSRTTTEWDFLTYLAQREGMDCYVTGTTLHFKQPVPATGAAWLAHWQPAGGNAVQQGNVTSLKMARSLTLAKDIEVWVRSWNAKQARSFTKKAKAIGAKSGSAQPAKSNNVIQSATQRYVYVIPNLSEDDAQKRANALLADLSKHERSIVFDAPGDPALTPRTMVQLSGTGTQFDQAYFVDSIGWHVSFDQGFTMTVAAKNHDSRSQAIPG